MEFIKGKCFICSNSDQVLSSNSKKVFLDLLRDHYLSVNELDNSKVSNSLHTKTICVCCAYSIKCCADIRKSLKKQITNTKKTKAASKLCSFCKSNENVCNVNNVLAKNIENFIKNLNIASSWKAKILCLKCGACVVGWNQMLENISKLNTTSQDSSSKQVEAKTNVVKVNLRSLNTKPIRNKSNSVDMKLSPGKRTRKTQVGNSIKRQRTQSPVVSRNSRKKKQSFVTTPQRLLRTRNKLAIVFENVEHLTHLNTIYNETKLQKFNIAHSIVKDRKMMFDISYVSCGKNINSEKFTRNSQLTTETIEISSSDDGESVANKVEPARSLRKRKAIYKMKIKLVKKKKKHICKICSTTFNSVQKYREHNKIHKVSKNQNNETDIKENEKNENSEEGLSAESKNVSNELESGYETPETPTTEETDAENKPDEKNGDEVDSPKPLKDKTDVEVNEEMEAEDNIELPTKKTTELTENAEELLESAEQLPETNSEELLGNSEQLPINSSEELISESSERDNKLQLTEDEVEENINDLEKTENEDVQENEQTLEENVVKDVQKDNNLNEENTSEIDDNISSNSHSGSKEQENEEPELITQQLNTLEEKANSTVAVSDDDSDLIESSQAAELSEPKNHLEQVKTKADKKVDEINNDNSIVSNSYVNGNDESNGKKADAEETDSEDKAQNKVDITDVESILKNLGA